MSTGNLVNLEKTSEMHPIRDESWLATQNKTFDNFDRKLKINQHLNFPLYSFIQKVPFYSFS